MVASVMVMVTITLYGEGTKKLHLAAAENERKAARLQALKAQDAKPDKTEVPIAESADAGKSIDLLKAPRQ